MCCVVGIDMQVPTVLQHDPAGLVTVTATRRSGANTRGIQSRDQGHKAGITPHRRGTLSVALDYDHSGFTIGAVVAHGR